MEPLGALSMASCSTFARSKEQGVRSSATNICILIRILSTPFIV